jgi:hypothetical protein
MHHHAQPLDPTEAAPDPVTATTAAVGGNPRWRGTSGSLIGHVCLDPPEMEGRSPPPPSPWVA